MCNIIFTAVTQYRYHCVHNEHTYIRTHRGFQWLLPVRNTHARRANLAVTEQSAIEAGLKCSSNSHNCTLCRTDVVVCGEAGMASQCKCPKLRVGGGGTQGSKERKEI